MAAYAGMTTGTRSRLARLALHCLGTHEAVEEGEDAPVEEVLLNLVDRFFETKRLLHEVPVRSGLALVLHYRCQHDGADPNE